MVLFSDDCNVTFGLLISLGSVELNTSDLVYPDQAHHLPSKRIIAQITLSKSNGIAPRIIPDCHVQTANVSGFMATCADIAVPVST